MKVEFAPNLFSEANQFAGSDSSRIADMQWAMDHPTARAIWCARGGYGTVRILDRLDWTRFRSNPKWITGYSDITALHGEVLARGFHSLHAAMPLNVANNTTAALQSLLAAWRCEPQSLSVQKYPLQRDGHVKGVLTGGNLSVLYSVLGSSSEPPLDGAVLFLEDLDEYLYHIDRMLRNMERNGWFRRIAGLAIGGMTDMNDNEIPFGATAEESIRAVVDEYDFPVAFGFPAGHLNDNRALELGARVELRVDESGGGLRYL